MPTQNNSLAVQVDSPGQHNTSKKVILDSRNMWGREDMDERLITVGNVVKLKKLNSSPLPLLQKYFDPNVFYVVRSFDCLRQEKNTSTGESKFVSRARLVPLENLNTQRPRNDLVLVADAKANHFQDYAVVATKPNICKAGTGPLLPVGTKIDYIGANETHYDATIRGHEISVADDGTAIPLMRIEGFKNNDICSKFANNDFYCTPADARERMKVVVKETQEQPGW